MSVMEQTVRTLVELIASGDYEAAVAAGNGRGRDAGDLREEVEAYGFEVSRASWEVQVDGLHVLCDCRGTLASGYTRGVGAER